MQCYLNYLEPGNGSVKSPITSNPLVGLPCATDHHSMQRYQSVDRHTMVWWTMMPQQMTGAHHFIFLPLWDGWDIFLSDDRGIGGDGVEIVISRRTRGRRGTKGGKTDCHTATVQYYPSLACLGISFRCARRRDRVKHDAVKHVVTLMRCVSSLVVHIKRSFPWEERGVSESPSLHGTLPALHSFAG